MTQLNILISGLTSDATEVVSHGLEIVREWMGPSLEHNQLAKGTRFFHSRNCLTSVLKCVVFCFKEQLAAMVRKGLAQIQSTNCAFFWTRSLSSKSRMPLSLCEWIIPTHLHGTTLEDHLGTATDPEQSQISKSRNISICPCNISAK